MTGLSSSNRKDRVLPFVSSHDGIFLAVEVVLLELLRVMSCRVQHHPAERLLRACRMSMHVCVCAVSVDCSRLQVGRGEGKLDGYSRLSSGVNEIWWKDKHKQSGHSSPPSHSY